MTPLQRPVNLAILGIGRWGSQLLRNCLALPQARVVAIADPDPQPLQRWGQLGMLPATVGCYTDWQQAMAIPGLDAVVIATPASTHDRLIRTALAHRYHVLSTKPLTPELASSQALCHLAAAQGCQLVVDHTYLFHPAVQQGYEICHQGLLGPLRYAQASRTQLGPIRDDVDVFWDLAIHDLSILWHWLGRWPTRVTAWGTAWHQPQPQPGFPTGLRDVGWVRLAYEDGFQATVHSSWVTPDRQRRLVLVGDQGTLVFEEGHAQPALTLHSGEGATAPTDVRSLPSQIIPLAPMEPLSQLCRHFLACVTRNTASTLSPGWLAADLVYLLQAIAQSTDTGQPVAIDPCNLNISPRR
ncbi:Gfo/Idh/MocA family oxidoreductase [Nodosilinea sp. P-1105]|uniref:Gfo/Idh/MocA family protein n=1 Tax=Nodosilinea sp. P-1105 TaxID=2546229 RepID=UPI001F0F68DF|nr:Gfo/Idh/MocA family oxidoreductase [Nodosilinea sp. P-1105]